jgi:hypothetical protein
MISKIKELILIEVNWIFERRGERTSLDGALLVLIGILILLGTPFVKLAAWIAIFYGAWTIWKSE